MPPIRRNKGASGEPPASRRKIAGRSTPRPSTDRATPETESPETQADREAQGNIAAEPDQTRAEPEHAAEEDPEAVSEDDTVDADDGESPSFEEPERAHGAAGDDETESDGGDAATEAQASEDEESEPVKRGSSFRLSKGLAAAGIVIGIAAGAGGLFLATNPGIDADNEAFVDGATTDEVRNAATEGVQRLVAIDYETLDEYQAGLDEYLAPHLVDELNETWDVLSDTYEQTQTAVEAQVREVGVSHLSDDRAEVLLVQDVSMTREGVAAGSTSGTYLVGLERIDGDWKLSQIPDLPS